MDQLQFRRSYADIQFRDMSDEELDSLKNSNPFCCSVRDTSLLKTFYQFGLLDKNYGLIRSMFINENKTFELGSGDKKITCRIIRPVDSADYGLYDMELISGSKQYRTRVEGRYGNINEDIKYLLLDIVPGGYKEIVILEEYYIMNGDNSDVHIYEIKNN